MNRLKLRLPKVALGAILLFLVSSSAFAQVSYSITGTLVLTSAPSTDTIGLNGLTVTATAILSQSMTPSSSTTTGSSSTNTYAGVSGVALGSVICQSPVTVTLTDNLGAPDTL